MTKTELEEYRKELLKLSENEKIERDLFLRKIALGQINGPKTGLPSLDKPWLKYYSEDQIKAKMPNLSIYDYLKENNKNNLDCLGFDDNGMSVYTFRQLFEMIDATANSLYKMGTKKGKIILGLMPQIVHENLLLYGVDKVGGAISFLIPDTPVEKIIESINTFNTELFFVFGNMLSPEMEEKIYESTSLKHIIGIEFFDSLNKQDKRTITWNEFIQYGLDVTLPEIGRDAEDLLFLAKTGGTTGVPKNVMLNDRCFNVIAHQLTNSDLRKKYEPHDKWLRLWPLFSATAAISSNHSPLCNNMEMVTRMMMDVNGFDKILLETKANHLTLVPAIFDSLKKSPLIVGQDLSFIKSAGCGGSKILESFEEETEEFFKKNNIDTFLGYGYGNTENSSVATMRMTPETSVIGGTGVPLVKTNVAVFAPDTEEELGFNEEGEICFNSDSFMMGYYNNEKESNEVIRKHKNGETWLHTGDIGYIDENGQVIVNGRMTRVIQTYPADKAYPSSIEEVIQKVPGVDYVAVVRGLDPKHEGFYVPAAFIVVNQSYNSEEVKENVFSACFQAFPPYAVPNLDNIIIKDSLPVTPMGKYAISELEDEIWNKTKLSRKK